MSLSGGIYDIRRHGCGLTDLRSELVAGLLIKKSAKHIPSLLLWNEKGLELFGDITSAPDYYPYKAELDLLNKWNEHIVASVEPGTVIVELGAGSCKKTGVLLQALHRQQKSITYFALDVAAESLTQSLSQMRCMLDHSNITNMARQESADILRRLLQYPNAEMLVSIDGNQSAMAIKRAYDLSDGEMSRFVRNGLTHANRLLREDVFKDSDWEFESCWDADANESDATAVCAWNGSFTYGQLQLLSSSLGARLSAQGVRAEEFVPIYFEKSRWVVVAILGVLKAGGAFVLLDSSNPFERLRWICQKAKASLVVASSRNASAASRLAASVVVVGEKTQTEQGREAPETADKKPAVTPNKRRLCDVYLWQHREP
ncbi:uncharacterized protein BDV17DRAFT_288248 [Aspergillus undulatus]|uniref:uncharacterized protein n=1 Tax=Aspergillus undulatus TaxID=1810928 RepID=UPI003CCC9C2D